MAVAAPVLSYPRVRRPETRRGTLQLDVRPITAQIYVDGFFVGTVEDVVGSSGVALDHGAHLVELVASGLAPAAFEVTIQEGATTRQSWTLARTGASPSGPWPSPVPVPAVATPAPRTFYVVPGCYAGDSPPVAARLPSGCRASDVHTILSNQSLTAR